MYRWIIAWAVLFAFQACTNEKKDKKNDITPVGKEGNKSVSVAEPAGPVTKRVSDSIFNGEYVERYPNGVVYKRGIIAGALAQGEWLTFYKDGKLWSRGTYKNGLRQGYGVSFWANGQKSSEGYYKDGKMVGKWIWWDEFGNKVEKVYPGTPDTLK